MKVSEVEMTPVWAAELLANNQSNRNPRSRVIEKYARAIINGEWQVTGDAIRIANDGTLIDGQHRLMASVRAERSFPTLLVEGLDPEAQITIDTGAPRRFRDILTMRGEQYPGTLASALRMIATYLDEGNVGSKNVGYSNFELLRLLNENPSIRDAVIAGESARRQVMMSGSLLSVAYWLFAQLDVEDADAFMERLGEGADLSANSPLLQLRKAAEGWRTARAKVHPNIQLAYIIKAWNLWREGREVKQLVWRAGGRAAEGFPVAV